MLRYHRATANLLGRDLTPAPHALALLEEREHILGIRLPAAVREWYSLPDATRILAAFSNDDRPVPLDRLGDPTPWEVADAAAERHERGMLEVMVENQGVCRWVVKLDGTDDPPVLVEDYRTGDWRPYADSFSTFIYTSVWDYSGPLFGWDRSGGGNLWALSAPTSPAVLPTLYDQYTGGPRTFTWPTPITHRLSDSRNARKILVQEDGKRLDYYLWATSADTLVDLATSLLALGAFTSSSLNPIDDDLVGALALERILG